MVEAGGQEEEFHSLLECYMFLKVWGIERMSELRGVVCCCKREPQQQLGE